MKKSLLSAGGSQAALVWVWVIIVCSFVCASTVIAAPRQMIRGHLPKALSQLAPIERLSGKERLRLAISLPLRNQQELKELIARLSDPTSPDYRKYLVPAQFTERFGPTEQDYAAVIEFAKANGLTVTTQHPNRIIVDVEGSVSDIEKAFHVKIHNYQHPKETRKFYAPDTEPSVDLGVPLLEVSGLDNYSIPHPNLQKRSSGAMDNATPKAGSGPGGAYAAGDFRAAYVPGTSLTGSGQSVGLLQFDGYYASDIAAYKTQFGLPDVPLVNVPVDGGVSTPGSGNSEVCLDIEMVISMAPGVSAIYVYQAPNPSPWVDLLSKMANDNLSKQLSCSWGGGGPSAAAEAIFQQMAVQGQTFFNATGDSDAFTGSISFPSDSPNITEVGATTLTTSGAGGSYISETVWNWGGGTGSSGGTSTYYSIPSWQQGVSMSGNQGSTTMRNVPDVSLTGDNVFVRYNNGGTGSFGGTSCAAPLWAAFIALVNQQAATAGRPSVGFLNPTVYALGTSGTYSSVFHDTTTGNNFSTSSPSRFSAVTGYDLCTGWGSPLGTGLINALAGSPTPVITSGTLLAPGTTGTTYTQTLAASGGAPPYSWSISSGTLPKGLGLSSGGVISGAPSTPGTSLFTVKVTGTDGLFSTAALSLTIYKNGTPLIATSSPLTTGTATWTYSQTLSATGGAVPYAWSIASGSLPSGLTLSGAGVISGTPTTSGTANFTVQVTGADGLFSTTPFVITINPAGPPPSITTASPLPTGAVGSSYNQSFTATGGTPPYQWSIASGSLPKGLNLTSAGALSGTPATTGTATFTTQVTDSHGGIGTKDFILTITPPAAFSYPLDTDPGWTRQGQWAFGKPSGGGGASYGSHDPTAGATGTNVFGVNLAGDYSTAVGGPYYLTTGALNFSNYTGVKLQFQRWLNTDYQPYVSQTVEVSNNGTTWTQVFANPTSTPIVDTTWTSVQYDISSIADKQSGVYVRWGYAILSSAAFPYSGWNIDDIQFVGNSGALALKIPANASEADGIVTGTATLPSAASTSTVVSLVSSAPNTITVPATVTIPAASTSAGFNLAVLNDSILNGTRTATITASSSGFISQSGTITITDDESANLSVALPSSVTEGQPAATGTVTMDAPAGADIAVTLSSSDPARLVVGNAIIPAGQTSGTFSASAVDDNKINGTETVSVTAHVANWTDGSASIDVLDNENTNLILSVPATAREGDGTKTGIVQISGVLASDLVVSLASDNTDKILVPTTVTISAGHTSGTFTMTIVDNTVADGAQTAMITASASGFNSAFASVVVADNDPDHFGFSTIPSPQISNAPFSVSITAYAIDNTVITNYAGTLALSGSGSTGAVPLSPASAAGFANGVWTGNVSVGALDPSVTVICNDGAGHTSVSNSFAVGTGPLHHFGFAPISQTQTAGTPFPVTITALDAGNNTVTKFSGQISLAATSGSGSGSNASVLITEVDTSDLDQIEFTNVTNAPIDFSGWKFIAYDWNAWPAPDVTYTFPANSICPAGGVFRLIESGGTAPGSFPTYYIGTNIYWNNNPTGNPVGALLFDSSNRIVDFVCAFDANPASITSPVTIPASQWSGVPIPANTTPTSTYQRTGNSDNNTNSDWVVGAGTQGVLNPGLTVPFPSALTSIPVTPTITGTFVAGVWSGTATVSQPYLAVSLSGSDNLGHSGTSNAFDVKPVASLGVTPATGMSASGGIGGPFTPASTSYTINNTGMGSMDWTISGTSSWLAFSPTGGTLGSGSSITVTATINTQGAPVISGTYSDTIAFTNTTNGIGNTTRSAVLTVLPPPPSITSALTATGAAGLAFTYQIVAKNNPTSFSATGLPAGLAVSTATGLISGTPAVVGTSSITLGAINASGTGSATLVLTVLSPVPVITGALTSTGVVGSAMNYQITASNNPTSFNANGLPQGFSINTASGLISGLATATGTTNAVITAINASGTGSASLKIMVVPSPAPVIKGAAFTTPTQMISTSGWPYSNLVQGPGNDDNLYGTTHQGGNSGGPSSLGYGMIYKINLSGGLTTMYQFSGTDGSVVMAGLIHGSSGDDNLYGTTVNGGPSDMGTVFKITPTGSLTMLHSFSGTDGANLGGGLLLGSDGNFYGTASAGGANNAGAIFRISPGGSFKLLYSFQGNTDGSGPNCSLAWGNDGNLYGTTTNGGNSSKGTVFRFTTGGVLTTLATFTGTNGANPFGTLLFDGTGNFYGTTNAGGAFNDGALFRISMSGSMTTLYSFSGHADSINPFAGLIRCSADGNFYGTTDGGGSSGTSTVYKLTPGGSFTTICTLGGIGGRTARGGLVEGRDGNLYGATSDGGTSNTGNIYKITRSAIAVSGSVGSAFSYQIDATNSPTSYSATGLPSGLSVDTATGLISGTPSSSGNTTATISASNSGGTGTATLTIAVVLPPPPVITSPLSATGTNGTAFSYQIAATNNPAFFAASGLPTGLTVAGTTGIISGTPAVTGTFSSSISATNPGGTGSASLTITVLPPPPVLTSPLSATGTTGAAFSYQIMASNNPTSFAASGLPPGLSLDTTTGIISGTPAQSGTTNVTLSATNITGTISATLRIIVLTPYSAWQIQKFTPAQLADPSICGDMATPAKDGVPNLMKYALNLNPMIPATSGLPVLGVIVGGSNLSFLTLTYTQVIGASDITYVSEVSSDLKTWNSGSGYTVFLSGSNNPDGLTQTVVIQDLTPKESTPKRFIRLKITRP